MLNLNGLCLIFVSDLHIQSAKDPTYGRLLSLIQKYSGPQNIICLGGDIFDLWVQNRNLFLRQYQEYLDILAKSIQNGTQVLYIEGNHDFCLKDVYKNYSPFLLSQKEFSISINQKKFYLAHGDLVNLEDRGYLFLRWILRSAPLDLLWRVIPESGMLKIAHWLSTHHGGALPQGQDYIDKLKQVFYSFCRKKFERGYDFVILGHNHIKEIWKDPQGKGVYGNPGFPAFDHQVLVWNAQSPQEINWQAF